MHYGCRPRKTFLRESCRWIFYLVGYAVRNNPRKSLSRPSWKLSLDDYMAAVRHCHLASLVGGWFFSFALPSIPFPDCNIRQYEKTELEYVRRTLSDMHDAKWWFLTPFKKSLTTPVPLNLYKHRYCKYFTIIRRAEEQNKTRDIFKKCL